MTSLTQSRLPRSFRRASVATCALALLATFAEPSPARAVAPYQFQAVALSGDPVPGFTPDVTFRWFGAAPGIEEPAPSIDLDGNVSFGAGWTQFFAPQGLFVWRNGVLDRLVVTGDPATPVDADFTSFSGLIPIAASVVDGRSSFNGAFLEEGQTAEEQGVWADRSGPRELIFRMATQPPGTVSGARFFQWFHIMVGGGHVVVNARYSVGSSSGINDHGFWRDDGSGLQVVALARTQAPGVPAGVQFGNGTGLSLGAFQTWDVDSGGHVSFNAMLMNGGVSSLNDEGVWTEGPGPLSLLAREGDFAPGFGHPNAKILGNSGFRTFAHDDVVGVLRNASGHVGFGARVDVPGADNKANAVYVSRGNGLELVTYGRFPGSNPPGAQAPGFPPGDVITRFFGERMNGLGELAFQAAVDSGGGLLQETAALFVERGGALVFVTKIGAPAPVPQPGVTFTTLFPMKFFDNGQLVFHAQLSNGRFGYFLANPDGTLQHIISTGALIEVAPGDNRVVTDLIIGGGLGKNRELAFSADFAGGSEAILRALPTDAVDAPVVAQSRASGIALRVLGPNPFGSRIGVAFDLAAATAIELRVHDVAGREVATLAHGVSSAGSHEVDWRGQDSSGRQVAAGVYFVSLEAGGAKETRRIVRLR